jgi:hypothetical protein
LDGQGGGQRYICGALKVGDKDLGFHPIFSEKAQMGLKEGNDMIYLRKILLES